MTLPLLIGGATTSRAHTALRIAPAYSGPVIHVLDASRAVGVASALVSDGAVADELSTAPPTIIARCARAARGGGTASLRRWARRGPTASCPSIAGRARVRRHPGMHGFDDWPLDDLIRAIDWTPFFRAWELAGNYPAILEDDVVGESARSLFADAQAMLGKIVEEKWLTAQAARSGCGRCGARATTSSCIDDHEYPPAHPPPAGRRSAPVGPICASPISSLPNEEDWLGGFAVGDPRHRAASEAVRPRHDDYRDILLKALADRLAEALAERLHQHVRDHVVGLCAGREAVATNS